MGNVSPIGVLNSVFETIHMGQLASKKEEQAKAKAKAEALDKGVTSSFDVLKSDPSLAYNFITSSIPAIKNQRLFFKEQKPFLYSTILQVAMQPKKISETNMKLIEQSKGNASFARNILRNMPNLPTDVKAIISSHASTVGMNEQENKLYATVKDKKMAKALRDQLFPIIRTSKVFEPEGDGTVKLTLSGDKQTIIDTKTNQPIEGYDTEYRGGNVEGGLYYALTAKLEEEDEVEPLSIEALKMIRDDIKGSNKPLERYKHYANTISKKDIQAHMFLTTFREEYVKSGKIDTIGEILKDTVKSIDGLGSTEIDKKERAIISKGVLNYAKIKELINDKNRLRQIMENPKDDAELNIRSNLTKIFAARDIIAQIDNKENKAPTNMMVGKLDLGVKDINEATKSRATSNNFLQALNDFRFFDNSGIDLDLNAYLQQLKVGNDDDKQKRNSIISNIKTVLKAHNNYVTGSSVPLGTMDGAAKRDEAEDNYAGRFKNLYAIKEIKDFIDSGAGLNQSAATQSMTPNVINSDQFVQESENTLLPPNQVRLIDGRVAQVSEDTVEFSNWAGYGPDVKAMFKDEGNVMMLETAGSEVGGLVTDSDNLFKTANKIRKNVPRIRSVANLTTKDFAKIGYMMINNDVNSSVDQFNVLSSLMSNRHGFQVPANKLALSVTEVNEALKQLSGNYVDIDKLSEKNDHLTKYIQLLNKVLSDVDFEGDATGVGIFIRNLRVDIFGEDGILIEGVEAILPENIEFDLTSGVSATEQANNIRNYSKNFAKRVRNADLASTLITLAYHRARSLDPAGRISDRDFKSALDSISGPFLASNKITTSLITNLLDDAKQEETFFTKVSDVLSTANSSRNFRLLDSHVRTFKALPYMNKLRSMHTAIKDMRKYRDYYNSTGTYDDQLYDLDLFKENDENPDMSVYQAVYKGSSNPIARGIPVYTDGNGKILTIQELRERGVRL